MTQKKVKLKLKSNAKKPLMIIGVILLVIVIFLVFYFNRIGELKSLGYSEKAAKSIIFKFKYSYVMNIGENKTLNAAFESGDYNEDNIDNYVKIDYEKQEHLISNINKLLNKGYSVDEVNLIIQLDRWVPSREYTRVGVEENEATEEILGVKIPKVVVPVSSGRSMSVIIEAAVMNMRLREYGVDSSKEFVDRILKNIDKNKG